MIDLAESFGFRKEWHEARNFKSFCINGEFNFLTVLKI